MENLMENAVDFTRSQVRNVARIPTNIYETKIESIATIGNG